MNDYQHQKTLQTLAQGAQALQRSAAFAHTARKHILASFDTVSPELEAQMLQDLRTAAALITKVSTQLQELRNLANTA